MTRRSSGCAALHAVRHPSASAPPATPDRCADCTAAQIAPGTSPNPRPLPSRPAGRQGPQADRPPRPTHRPRAALNHAPATPHSIAYRLPPPLDRASAAPALALTASACALDVAAATPPPRDRASGCWRSTLDLGSTVHAARSRIAGRRRSTAQRLSRHPVIPSSRHPVIPSSCRPAAPRRPNRPTPPTRSAPPSPRPCSFAPRPCSFARRPC